MKFKYKAVIFDQYSTLVWEDAANPFYDRVASDLGTDVNAFLTAYKSLGTATMSGKIVSMGERVSVAAQMAGFSGSSKLAHEIGERHLYLWLRSIRIYDDTHAALDLLRGKGFKLGLLSNASSYSEHILSMAGLRRHFDATILSYQIGQMKPATEAYRFTAELLGVRTEDCIYIGDGGDNELAGAHGCDMTTVLLDRNLKHTESAAADADLRVSSLLEAVNACFTLQREDMFIPAKTA
ncbi:putative hydrolase protein [Rhizobium etli CFN 42]|uniref:Hydrolase protein n=1 Tax=Rhizobium etli (strain ATCC 51251 / DSM 11541 / JCM 21823 / NBRC 15573 / CFN 42) TaxID=347834 RepID=Q2K8S1_RHIEC|nr:HAD family hydrolase [Rhizobium etli]ABC90765.1 putative hydrolase protein [Rhizobium etli CFN 42]